MSKHEDESDLQLLTEAGVGKLSDIQITKDDIVTIAVARREQQLLEEREDLEEKLRNLRQEAASLEEQLEEAVEAQVEEFRPSFNDTITALQTSGFKVQLEIEAHLTTTKTSGKIHAEMWLRPKDGESRYSGLSITKTLKVNETVAGILKRSEVVKTISAETEKALITVRRDLGQLGSLERQAKAQVAMQLLSNSKQGQQLLSMMDRASSKLLSVKKK